MQSPLTSRARVASWCCQVLVAAILAQTLFFKFTGAPEARAIFEALGAEPWGRIGTGVAELAAALLLLVPGTAVFGALLTLGLMAGAIGSHLLVLGIESAGDGGLLFGLALVCLVASALVVWLRRERLWSLLPGRRAATRG
jgi:DNA-binding transcriptional ArsR family regulator